MLILGSASPRRREILEGLHVPHVVLVASVNEDLLPGEPPEAYLARVVRAKLDAVRALVATTSHDLRATAQALLVADTSVLSFHDGPAPTVLGKPAGTEGALRMVTLLAGATHEVHTRFALASLDGAFLHEETVRTKVTFRPLTAARAAAYAATGEGLDKAGGYAVQGLGGALVSRLEGSYSNVVGLPACEVSVALERLAARTVRRRGE